MSRFESNLLEAIRAEVTELGRSVFQLAWAAYRVRIGDVSAARGVVADVRLRYSNNYNAQIFAHINFVEGLCEFFENGIDSAIPKLIRSGALANGCPAGDDLPGLVRAWLAGLHRNRGNWQSMTDFLISAAGYREGLSSEAICRLSLVAADAFQEIEAYVEAARWYGLAHQHAIASGDDAALSAILYNRAAIRIFNLRLEEVRGGQIDTFESRIALEAASAKNYTQYIRDGSMRWGFGLMTGQLLLLKFDYAQALNALDSLEVRDLEHQWPSVDLVRRADVFRCHAMLGRIDPNQIKSYADQIWSRSGSISGAGDRAIAAYSLSVGLHKFDYEVSSSFLSLAREALNSFDDDRRREAVELNRFIQSSDVLIK